MEDKEIETPNFEHDCENCVFLGIKDGKDLYWCSQGSSNGRWTVLARFGDSGPNYSSGAVFAKPGGDEDLHEAKLRAIKKGLIDADD